ncbi:MAG TPA: sigma-70 family RNA polymerase sigma factor [Gemmatimonadales bacterium]|nr:sigma-70 family RNA polymerase sigma factor [Gemmatimonadales bacterium]
MTTSTRAYIHSRMEDWLLELKAKRVDAAWDLFVSRYRRVIFAAIRHYARDHDDVMDVFARVCEALRDDGMRRIRTYVDSGNRRARFSTWLVTVVRNLTVDWFRQRDGRRRAGFADVELTALGRAIAEQVYRDGHGHVEAYELICSRDPPGPSFREYLAELRSTHRALAATRLRYVLRELAPPPPDQDAASVPELRDQRERLDAILRSLPPEERLVVQLYVMEEVPAAAVARVTGLANPKAVYNTVYRILPVLRARLAEAGIHAGDL